jgi:hypothetical protein
MANSPIFGAGRLINSNATLSVYKYTISQVGGGTVYTLSTTVATGVEVLITLFGGSRSPGEYMSDAQKDTGTVTGVSAFLNTTNTAFKITAFPDMPEFVDTFWRVVSPAHHPAGLGGLQSQRVTSQIERLDFPIT